MANMPAATYPYSMLGYGYPPAYLQLPAGYSQQQLSGLLAGLGAQNLTGLGAQSWATAAVAANTAAVNPLMSNQQSYSSSNSKQGYPVIAPMATAAAVSAGGPPKLCYPGSGGSLPATAAAAPDKSHYVTNGRASSADQQQPEVRQEGEGDEYLQELIKERDAIESSTTSSLSKTHILRLLNKGDWDVAPSILSLL